MEAATARVPLGWKCLWCRLIFLCVWAQQMRFLSGVQGDGQNSEDGRHQSCLDITNRLLLAAVQTHTHCSLNPHYEPTSRLFTANCSSQAELIHLLLFLADAITWYCLGEARRQGKEPWHLCMPLNISIFIIKSLSWMSLHRLQQFKPQTLGSHHSAGEVFCVRKHDGTSACGPFLVDHFTVVSWLCLSSATCAKWHAALRILK